MAAKITNAKQEKIVKEARELVDAWFSGFSENIKKYENQLKFWLSMRDQWSADERSILTSYNKIPLTCPKIYGIARRIIGEQRQSTPDLQVTAITDKATPDALKLRDDFVRTVSSHSDAHIAYQTAFRSVLFGGFGAFRVYPKYESPNSFNQCMNIGMIQSPTRCFWDISAKETAKEDGLGCGEYLIMSRRKFEQKYPDIDVPSQEPMQSCGYTIANKDEVAIIIYQRKEFFTKKIVQLANGDVVDLERYEEMVKEYVNMKRIELGLREDDDASAAINVPEELRVVKKRNSRDYKIRQYKIAGDKILEHSTWPSKYFGYIFVDGDSSYIDGKQITKPFFEDAQDLQRFGNYLFTQINHLVKAMRNETWIASPENIAGHEDIWTNPDLTQAVLLANPDSNRGGAMPINFPPSNISPVLIQQYDSLMNNINTTLGLYDAYQGAQGNELSGKALDNRVKQGNIATFVVNSNLNRAIGQCGKVLLDSFPRVYDTQRPITLTSRDGSVRTIMLNEAANGEIRNDTSGEDYAIQINAGSSFEGQKQEALNSLRELLQINPAISTLTADLFAENLPLQNNQVIVKRLRAALVPEEVVAAGNGETPEPKEPPPPPPEVQYMMQDLELRKLRQETEAMLKQEKLDLERQKNEFEAWRDAEKLKLDAAKNGIYFEEQISA